MKIYDTDIMKAIKIPISRDLKLESQWSFDQHSKEIEEAICHYCKKAFVSDYMKKQISRIMHQGYVLIGDTLFASPVRSIFETMELIANNGIGRGKLNNISNKVGFEVLHCHFAQSSCIEENWLNFARQNKLLTKPLTQQETISSLLSSLSKQNKTGEWIVYSEKNNSYKFWCIWLHSENDSALIEVIKQINTSV